MTEPIDLDALEKLYSADGPGVVADMGDREVVAVVRELRFARKVVEALSRLRGRDKLPGIWYLEHLDFNGREAYETYADTAAALADYEASQKP